MARKKQEDTRTPQKIIADMCPLLESFGATYVCYSYEGSDYEGDIDTLRCEYAQRDEVGAQHFAPQHRFSVHQGTYTDPTITAAIPQRNFREVIGELTTPTADKPALITHADAEKFEAALCQVLPRDWQENAGSYGSVAVNTVTKKIEIHHTKRIIQTQNQTITYAAGSDTPTITDA